MWNLPKPDIQTSIREIDDVITHSRTLKADHKDMIEALYNDYDRANGTVTRQRHDQLPGEVQRALKTAYPKTYENGELVHIRQRLCQGVYKCPICSIGLPSTLDHALPQSKYSALSVCGNNLVPMCSDCNRLKNAEEELPMLHPYYDLLPVGKRFLYADAMPKNSGGMRFTFRVDDKILTDPILLKKFNNTFEKCHLDNAFSQELVTYLKDKLYRRSLNSIEAVKQYMNLEIPREIAINGLNHWKTAVLFSIIENDDITLDHLRPYLD